jgi:putative aldouronate transport system permease protein
MTRLFYIKKLIFTINKEAARIDGAGEFRIFSQIMIPLSLPVMAAIGLMTAIHYWNDWLNGMYCLSERGGASITRSGSLSTT